MRDTAAATPGIPHTFLTTQLQKLSLNKEHSLVSVRSDINRPEEYRLPTLIQNSTWKKTILDPLTTPASYDLPAQLIIALEKVAPPTDKYAPIQDPGLLPGGVTIKKETMPYLVNIRHKKMKKHKLKKFRKRMIFLHRKLGEIKKKKKEQKMLVVERRFATIAQEFDAEKYIESHIQKAKQGGWKLDIIAERNKVKLEEQQSGGAQELGDAQHN